MIREITNYVFGTFKCSTANNFSVESNIIYEFDNIPTLQEIKNTCIEWCNENYSGYKWINCIIINLQFLSKSAFDQLSGKNENK